MSRSSVPLVVCLVVCLGTAGCTYPGYRGTRAPLPAEAVAAVETIPLPPPADPELVNQPALTLLRLTGDGYERGYRYGRAFPDGWRRATDELERQAVAYVQDIVKLAFVARFVERQYTARVAQRFSQSADTMPPSYRAYVQGIADGAGIDADRLLRSMAIIMLSDASCSAFVAFGPATEDGRLLQMRNLDWGDADLPASQGTVLLLHEPPQGQRWLSIGFVGLVGSISGINESGLSISEIGADSNDKQQDGQPMPILLERVLAEAHTLDEAVAVLRGARGTGGYNFMLGSARERRGVVVEKTATHTAVFKIGPQNYEANPYFQGFAGFDCRADTAADPTVRAVQDCSGGPGSPVGRGAYENRYRKQVDLFEGWGRKLDLARAEQLALAVAPRSNLHSILYDFERGRVYVRNQAWFRDGRKDVSREDRMRLRAAAQPAGVVDLTRYFRSLTSTPRAAALPRPAAAPWQDPPALPPPQVIRR